MNRPPFYAMNNMYRSPRPYNPPWRPNHAPPAQFQWRPHTHFGAHYRNEFSEEHWCETCDRGFATEDLLHKHKQQHQKCNIDGCQFVAHPKVITKHIQMQHSTGLYKKIANLNNPEEIQKWREERKKKYPTKSNIEKKAAECKEKIERGEKMFLKHDKRSDISKDHRPGLKRKYGFDKSKPTQRNNKPNFNSNSSMINKRLPPKKPRIIPSIPSITDNNKLKPFTGILNIDMEDKVDDAIETTNCSNDLIEDDYYEDPQKLSKEIPSTQEPVLCGALTSLMCDYGTSDEETEVKEELPSKEPTVPVQKPISSLNSENITIDSDVVNNQAITEIESKESDDDGPEEVKIVKTNTEHDVQEPVTIKSKEKQLPVRKTNPPRNEYNNNNQLRRKIPSTLLQKLLHNEIRQERNIVLQCIRYIKKNNYFDKPPQ